MGKEIIERPDYQLPAAEPVPVEQLWNDWSPPARRAADLAPTAEANLGLATVSIEAAVDDKQALNLSIEDLPESLKAKMRETLAIPPMKGGAEAAEAAFMSRLDEDELDAYRTWVEDLDEDALLKIRAWFNGQYR